MSTLPIGGIVPRLVNWLARSGGTMTGILTLAQDPVNALDAATKQYVDAAVAASSSWDWTKETSWLASAEQNANGTTTSVFGTGAPTATGSAAASLSADGSFINYTSGAVSGNSCGWTSPSTSDVIRAGGPIATFRVRTGPATANIRLWVGLANSSLAGTDDAGLQHVAAFRYSTAVDGTAFWRCYSKDGTTSSIITTGVAIANNTVYLLTIDMSVAGTITYKINGTVVGTETTRLPGNTTGLGYNITATTLEAVAKTLGIRRLTLTGK